MKTPEAIAAYTRAMEAYADAAENDLHEPDLNIPRATLTEEGEAAVMDFNRGAYGETATLDKTVCCCEAEDQADNFLRDEMAVVEIPSNRSADRKTHLLHLEADWFEWTAR